ncbi:MAG: tRNA glutamyl-Q(34) synthetase GluQRS [Halioglobus sp.]
MSTANKVYRGRFAPSPTGPLHMGSLIAALASFLDARHQQGEWLLRIEDLDPPRVIHGATDLILTSLDRHGLHWDGEVMWQGQRNEAYEHALSQLRELGLLFHCDCTRSRLGPDGSCSGRCLPRQHEVVQPTALRIAVPEGTSLEFDDIWQGQQRVALGRDTPDFILKRKDSLYAYQLAVVVDDAEQGISHIIRGSDILDSSARQLYLQQTLAYPAPTYGHIPLISDSMGQKLSKRSYATPLDDELACTNLRYALAFLQQAPPAAELECPEELLKHAVLGWSRDAVPTEMSIQQH